MCEAMLRGDARADCARVLKVKRTDYTVLHVDDEGYFHLLGEGGDSRADLRCRPSLVSDTRDALQRDATVTAVVVAQPTLGLEIIESLAELSQEADPAASLTPYEPTAAPGTRAKDLDQEARPAAPSVHLEGRPVASSALLEDGDPTVLPGAEVRANALQAEPGAVVDGDWELVQLLDGAAM